MTTVQMDRTMTPPDAGAGFARLSTRFGLAFTICQLASMAFMIAVILPRAGSPTDPALSRGERILDAASLYQAGNYVFMIAGMLLLGFLGAVHVRMRRVDPSGALGTVAVGAGLLLALIWPLSSVLHDVALEVARSGTDVRLLAGWDAIAPYSLAFSVLPRVFFVGALALGLRATGTAPWLQRTAVVILVLSVVGSATLVTSALFPLLALSTLGYELWVGALAWHWLRGGSAAGENKVS